VTPRALSSSLSARAIESNRVGSAWSFAYALSASTLAAAQAGSSASSSEAPEASSFGLNRMCRTRTAVVGVSASLSLRKISRTWRCGPGCVASATTLSWSFWRMTSPLTTWRYLARSMPSLTRVA